MGSAIRISAQPAQISTTWSEQNEQLVKRLALERAPRADAERSLLRTHCRYHGVEHFQREPTPILDGAAILVRALVRDILRELIDEVSVRRVDLDSVTTRAVHSIACGLRKRLNIRLDLCQP